jgi:hypothetical protein
MFEKPRSQEKQVLMTSRVFTATVKIWVSSIPFTPTKMNHVQVVHFQCGKAAQAQEIQGVSVFSEEV